MFHGFLAQCLSYLRRFARAEKCTGFMLSLTVWMSWHCKIFSRAKDEKEQLEAKLDKKKKEILSDDSANIGLFDTSEVSQLAYFNRVYITPMSVSRFEDYSELWRRTQTVFIDRADIFKVCVWSPSIKTKTSDSSGIPVDPVHVVEEWQEYIHSCWVIPSKCSPFCRAC